MSGMKRKKYEKFLEPMQAELVEMARWIAVTGQLIVVLFEGRDTAGKGGSIAMLARAINPRQCRVVALPKPSDANRPNGISSALSSICPRPVKSRCSTAAGTTVPGSRK